MSWIDEWIYEFFFIIWCVFINDILSKEIIYEYIKNVEVVGMDLDLIWNYP